MMIWRARCCAMGLCLVAACATLLADETAATKPALAPVGLSDDLTVWPNKTSYRNSDDWLWQNHDRIRRMAPRVIVLNFANDVDMAAIRKQTSRFVDVFAEATRYHGYDNPDAPVFMEYDVIRYVDLRDEPPQRTKQRKSSRMPTQPPDASRIEIDYGAFFTDDFAPHLGFRDPRDESRHLNLQELIEHGFVHELWFYAVHEGERAPALETVEYKQYYDEHARPIKGKRGPAGNGHDKTMPWAGRSFRIAFFNPHRGIGCQMENYGHQLEAIANHNAVAYYRKYFNEYAELDMDERYGLPFKSFYALWGKDKHVAYPERDVAVITYDDKEYRIDPYIAFGGNVHFPPGARDHYDLESPYTVLSRIENYRRRNGENGQDKILPFSKEKWQRYVDMVPDCMGQWQVFWMQSMPGLDNKSLDDDGKPMKNWWVFLFY